MAIHRIVPKSPHAVVWGWPDLEDQSRALIPHLLGSKKISHVVLLAQAPGKVAETMDDRSGKLEVLYSLSPRALVRFLTAKYVFFTHRHLVTEYPEEVVAVNLWHGMPIKKIGLLLEGSPHVSSRYPVVTSPFWAEIMQRSMPGTEEPLVCGLPRNDRFFLPRESVMKKLGLTHRNDIRKVVAWLPTYRKSEVGEKRTDGVDFHSPFAMPGVTPEELNAHCQKLGIFLWLKPHPMAEAAMPELYSHLAIVTDDALAERDLSLYELLGASDLLVSDVSSVYVDYLLLDRPVIHAFADREAYEKNRGFSVSPLEDYLAGPVVTGREELFAALEAFAEGHDPMAEKRGTLRQLFFSHPDGKASERLLKAIGL